MRKTLAVSLCSMFLILIFSSVALADTYEIPVITNGKIITLSVEVEGGVIDRKRRGENEVYVTCKATVPYP